MDGKNNNKKTKRSINIPDILWNNIPEKNKSHFINNAIDLSIQQYGHNQYTIYTDQQPLIEELRNQIEELKKDKDYLKYMALPIWKRWKIPRLKAPHKT